MRKQETFRVEMNTIVELHDLWKGIVCLLSSWFTQMAEQLKGIVLLISQANLIVIPI